jgi:hypothetical protein
MKSCENSDRRRMLRFIATIVIFAAAALCGLAAAAYYTGTWWTVPLYVVFWIVYYGGIELFLHCPRCPYWNDADSRINCILLAGMPKPQGVLFKKLLHYNSRPYSGFEKSLIRLSNYFATWFPIIMMISALIRLSVAGRPFLYLLALLLCYVAAFFWFGLTLHNGCCKRCLHFDCPVNKQPAELQKEYLDKNPELQKVWVQAGKYPGSRGESP